MLETVALTALRLPASKPRYLMGVGHPDDLVGGGARRIFWTALCRPAQAVMLKAGRRAARLTGATHGTGMTPDRLRQIAPARPAVNFHALTCTISFGGMRCSDPCCSPGIT